MLVVRYDLIVFKKRLIVTNDMHSPHELGCKLFQHRESLDRFNSTHVLLPPIWYDFKHNEKFLEIFLRLCDHSPERLEDSRLDDSLRCSLLDTDDIIDQSSCAEHEHSRIFELVCIFMGSQFLMGSSRTENQYFILGLRFVCRRYDRFDLIRSFFISLTIMDML